MSRYDKLKSLKTISNYLRLAGNKLNNLKHLYDDEELKKHIMLHELKIADVNIEVQFLISDILLK